MQIKFKAITTDGKWVEGDLITYGSYRSIRVCDSSDVMPRYNEVIVIPKTVCQFTGLHDKNGREIWNGDICYSNDRMGIIEYGHGRFGINWDYSTDEKSMLGSWGSLDNLRSLHDGFNEKIEITGNIFDNLLKDSL